jgi:hypothetical protein
MQDHQNGTLMQRVARLWAALLEIEGLVAQKSVKTLAANNASMHTVYHNCDVIQSTSEGKSLPVHQ